MRNPKLVLTLSAIGATVGAVAWLALAAQPPPEEGRQLFGRWSTVGFAVGVALVWLAGAFACAAASRRTLFGWLLATVLTTGTWLLLEVAGVLGVVSYPTLFGLEPSQHLGSHREPNLDVRGETREDLAVLWGIDRPAVSFRYRTDRRGFRNATDRPSADVYCVGDSFLVAGLLPWGETVTARLEAALSRPAMNLSIVGVGVQEQVELVRDAGVPLEGRLLLQFVYEGNDLVDSARYRAAQHTAVEEAPLAEKSFVHGLTVWLQRVTQPTPGEAYRHMGRLGGEDYFFLWDDYSYRGLEAEIDPLLDALLEMRGLVTAGGGSYGVVLVPSKIRVLGPYCTWPKGSVVADYRSQCGPLPDRLRDWAAVNAVDYLDLTAALASAARDGRAPYFPADTHWNHLGHEVAARSIAEWDRFRAWQERR